MLLETHPFTIACACEGQRDDLTSMGGSNGMVLMVKKSGDWTRKLHDIAMESKDDGIDVESSISGKGTRVKILVDGPYGMYHNQ